MKAKALQLVSPVGGWNARDALDQMPAEDAVQMTNWFPTVGRVETRKGYVVHASDLGGAVETIAEFNAGASRKMIAAANGRIFDVSLAGAVATPLATGFANNRWQSAQFDDASGGARMALVNGADEPQKFDGAAISPLSVSGSGLVATRIIGVNVYKNRSYFWEKDSQDFWYSAVNALGGTLTRFPLGRVSGFGGNLVSMATWTIDGGDGVDDLAVFIMSSGDVIIYQGSDPGQATDWALVGIFRLGAPVGIRGVAKVGSDLVVITKDGYIPLSKTLSSGRVAARDIVSDKINGAVRDAASRYSSNFGWQCILYPRGNYMLFNVPVAVERFDQHVLNTLTGAWTKFEGMNGICWSLFDDRLYFGASDGKVYLADQGQSDAGQSIVFSAQTAWNYLGSRGQLKRVTAVKPVFESEDNLPVSIAMAFDFENPSATYSISSFSSSGSLWDEALWDDSAWASDTTVIRPWISVAGIGLNVSARIISVLNAQSCKWYSLEYLFEPGGII